LERNANLKNGTRQPNGTSAPPPKADDTLPLPCHYFDYIVGTSTGG
jgi:hypothetical protein